MIFAAGGATLVVAPRYFERIGAMRAEFPVLVLFAALGMSVMVSAGDLITLYIGLELNSLRPHTCWPLSCAVMSVLPKQA